MPPEVENDPNNPDFMAFEQLAEGDAAAADPNADANENADSAADADPNAGAADDAAENDADPQRQRQSAQERINRAVRQQREAERQRDAARAELERIRAGAQPGQGTEQPAQDAPPDPSKYEYGELDTRFLRDHARYEARQEYARLRQEDEKRDNERRAQEQAQTIAQKVETVRTVAAEKYADLDDVLDEATAAGAQLTPTMISLMAESEPDVAADVVYHLAKNPKEAIRFQRLSPLRQAIEYGKLEAKYSAKDSGKGKTPGAPQPPQTKVRGASGKFSAAGDTTDFAAFEALANGRK